jgi:predicted secreted protein
VESVESGLKVEDRGSSGCAWWRIRVRKSGENGRCDGIFTVFSMPGYRANVENSGSDS